MKRTVAPRPAAVAPAKAIQPRPRTERTPRREISPRRGAVLRAGAGAGTGAAGGVGAGVEAWGVWDSEATFQSLGNRCEGALADRFTSPRGWGSEPAKASPSKQA